MRKLQVHKLLALYVRNVDLIIQDDKTKIDTKTTNMMFEKLALCCVWWIICVYPCNFDLESTIKHSSLVCQAISLKGSILSDEVSPWVRWWKLKITAIIPPGSWCKVFRKKGRTPFDSSSLNWRAILGKNKQIIKQINK